MKTEALINQVKMVFVQKHILHLISILKPLTNEHSPDQFKKSPLLFIPFTVNLGGSKTP